MKIFSVFLDRQSDVGGACLHFTTIFPVCHLHLSCHLRLYKSNAVDEVLLNKLRN
jgi:hypothetical protein